ncbi:sensor histidine kinase [Spirosoma utsteinense]|uniref:histidine kinase n=1 Tax=Spirosoma utsteinense TaxID=2585773 RepID=A0ABR6W388_9BACT|nr:PAS domain-containing sensor histidine kinase [Spirosoma utsteinense]MBC3786650.1 signal transduction histidine kinase [Spirosoma utsteinense]MBC3791013.1 signal transduction histidine kinase [Spirosoma utsteinense]
MRLTFRTRYLLYMVAVHAVLVALTFQLLKENKPLFIASEMLLVASIYGAIRIYRTFRQPAEFIQSGIEAIREKDFTVKFVPTGNVEVDELIRVYNLMIDQLRQERTRQAEQQFFLDKLVEAAPMAILIFDFDGRLSAVNPKARQLLHVTDDTLLTKPLSATNHPLLVQLSNLPPDQPMTLKGPGAETYRALLGQFIDQGFRRQFLFIEELTAEIIETEKKAYGKVIRMMAHEVNNSIGAVNSILTVTEGDLPDSELRDAVRVAIDRNDRLNRFMRRFADVVRLPTPNPAPADITELVRNVARLMQPQADGRRISLQVTIPDEPVVWSIDMGQLEQVLVNVVKNALEACGPGHTVELVVTGRQLVVRNDGPAIPDTVSANLFDPFFSTKADGQGIGLTLTREILLNHGLTFWLRSDPDGWTRFVIRLA